MNGKRILIWGYGREGKSTENFLKTYCRPASVDIFEGKREEIAEDKYDLIFKSPGIVMKEDHPKYTSQTEIFLSAFRDQTIGITGTKGKSTTSALLAHVLGECLDRPVLLVGNIGKPCLDYYGEITPDALVVFELSCHQLAHVDVSPHVALFLNLYEEHLDYYGTMEAYFQAKAHITRKQKAGDVFYCGENVPAIESEAARRVVTLDRTEEVPMQIYGEHNQLNAQFVRHVAEEVYGAVPEAVTAALGTFEALPHRLRKVGEFGGITWYDDSISTIPEAVVQAVDSLPKLGTVLVGGMDRGIHYGLLEQLILDHPEIRFVCMYATGARVLKELAQMGGEGKKLEVDGEIFTVPENCSYAPDLAGAVTIAKEVTPDGMGCALSPAAASYGYFKNFEERGDAFAKLVQEKN